ncbi:MAG: hypothetical protein HOJ15_01240 [Candidatus Jacksonbacteria bacterium]|jgi:SAM-dependent methyltransferase|nr:hypothetical protein [Candidatus Jacksonbacteria bacterium]MBT6034518.1 hypothetical protein [Candidatus Jacksonbacteria bacterium]MBT6301035.1 hypothetical protein [Candidatus Jacksonbacteria bacterium]MBT6756851.1 hypothetical protein [Candidatus Jacksonbacteria bacterium]MBT6955037.1 hypothetical protein [Candidatus Jacksonbacteria bacterium]
MDVFSGRPKETEQKSFVPPPRARIRLLVVMVHYLALFLYHAVARPLDYWSFRLLHRLPIPALKKKHYVYRWLAKLFLNTAYTLSIREGKGGVGALSSMYGDPTTFYAGREASRSERAWAWIWDSVFWNSPALRDRLMFTTDLLDWVVNESGVEAAITPGRLGFVASVGAGSARAAASAATSSKYPVGVIAIDKDPDALELTKKTAIELGHQAPLVCISGDATKVVSSLATRVRGQEAETAQNRALSFLGNGAAVVTAESITTVVPYEASGEILGDVIVVEVVGLLDYFTDGKIRSLLSQIRKLLVPGGYVVWSCVGKTLESHPVRNVVRWPRMFYRTPAEVEELTLKAGFESVTVHNRFGGYHNVAVAKTPVE